VDIEASADGGYDVGWTVAGEWMNYTVNVVTPGVYTMQSRVASNTTTGAFHVTMDGTNISGTVTVPNTGNFQYWQTVNTTTTYLTAGQHIMTVFIDAAGFNINYLSFVGPVTPGLTVNIAAPLNNVIYNAPATLPLTANVSASTGTITKVDFYANGTQVGETTIVPYTFNWTGVAVGTYIITAEVTNNSGATSTSAPVSITVNPAVPSCPLLTWSDEFNGNSLDLTKWNYQTGNGCPGICGWGNNELEYYTNNTNNVSVSGGALALTAQYQPNYNGSGNNYTSGKLVTLGNFSQKYGHFEARIKIPSAAGMWPAFWMLADSTAWPSTGEIDIEEAANKNPLTWFGTLHFLSSTGNNSSQGYTWNDSVPLSNDYHVYAVDWTTDSISFSIDSILRGTVSKTALVAAGGVWPFDNQQFYIIMNLAVGGNFTGQTPDPTQFPQSMLVDYVRVYSKNPCIGVPETPYGGTPWPIPGTIQAENYDNGGQGVAYNDSDPTNDGGQYRTTEGVDVETCTDTGGGYDVGYTAAGEWENYTVNVNTAGVYTLQARVASNSAGNSLHVEMDGVNISGSISVPNTGGFQTWQTVNVTTPALTV
ncbi:MAG TPA: carbohydrate-binding protein, partial [Bacteroidia bacterium]|nr:carbohydrate-binding protein [Bacteroidia bacterium]